MQTITAQDYARFLRDNSDEFLSITDSGYSSYFFATSFYKLWILNNAEPHIELWGNMGPHLVSHYIQQFSEVDCSNDSHTYMSDTFIFEAWGSRKRMESCFNLILDHISHSKDLLPYQIFIIRNELTTQETGLNTFNICEVFPEVEWHISTNGLWARRERTINIGLISS